MTRLLAALSAAAILATALPAIAGTAKNNYAPDQGVHGTPMKGDMMMMHKKRMHHRKPMMQKSM